MNIFVIFALLLVSTRQVRSGNCLQICTQTWVDWQEFSFLGTLSLQQFLGGAPQQQRDGHRAVPPPAPRGSVARLRRWLPGLLRRCGLPAPAHFPYVLHPTCLPRFQRVEQMSDSAHWLAHPRPPGGCWTPRLTSKWSHPWGSVGKWEGQLQNSLDLLWPPETPAPPSTPISPP